MSVANDLKQAAIEIANDAHARLAGYKAELREIEERKAVIEAQLNEAQFCLQRSLEFQPQIDGQFQCPRCWVAHETRSALTPIPGNDREDVFRCHTCHRDFSTTI